ncbi:two-component response regulator ORR21-like isoform X2 [Tripterygium wilfordii]|uniref:two-component response regulator ORR21-like isoform X2 n=1 Tax=Tripterygium wilfordii TaxID=458696 RepID=UPI0018F81A8C|nr:two-component response regulator ORR21-like isoform X2 [Tripterygium wilfordii]
MVASMLGQLTFKVTTAETASTALAMIRDEKERSFDLVIADVYMKDMIFLKFMGMVLKRDIPVIVMTSSACVDVAQKMLAKGASFCCEKPISSGDLRYVWQHVYRRRSNPMLRLSCSSQGSNSRKEAEMNFGNKQQGIEIHEPSFSSNATPRNNLPAIITDKNLTNIQFRDIALFAASDQQVIAADPKGKKKLSELEALEHDIDPRNKNKQFEAETYLGPNVCSTNGQLKSCSQGEGFMRRRPIADQESRNKGRQIHSMLEVSNHEDEEDQLKDQRGNTSKKRKRAVWTRELHLKFTTALSLLGDKTTPKAILRLMKVPEFNQRQVASHLQKYKAQVQRIYEASTTTLQSACELKTGVREVSAEKNNSLAKEQSQRGLEVGGAKTHPSQELFGYNSRFPEGTLSFNERLKLASSYINAQNQNQLLFPIQGQNTMLGRNLTIADKYPRNLPEVNKELQTIETSAPPALDENEEMSYFADILKALEEDTLEEDMNKTANLAGQPDACDIDKFCEWLEKDTP